MDGEVVDRFVGANRAVWVVGGLGKHGKDGAGIGGSEGFVLYEGYPISGKSSEDIDMR